MINRKSRNFAVASGALAAIFILIWVLFSFRHDGTRAWHALLINYLFFTSLAGGLVVWPAVVVNAYGHWMGIHERVCWTGLSFAIPSLIMLIILWIGSGEWVPWKLPYDHGEWWVNNTFLFMRNVAGQLFFWAFAHWVYRRRNRPGFRRRGAWLIFIYAIVFSLLGFDFIMALDREWYSMMIGGYYFVSGMYLAMAAWILLSIFINTPGTKQLHDMGKLLIAFCMLTTYLMFSQLFPIWYENLPHEAGYLVPRMNLAFKNISRLLLVMVYIGPIAMLLPTTTKKNFVVLGIIALIILSGMWIERWWLVSAVFEKEKLLFGWTEILPAAAFLAILLSGVSLSMPRIARFFKQEEIMQ